MRNSNLVLLVVAVCLCHRHEPGQSVYGTFRVEKPFINIESLVSGAEYVYRGCLYQFYDDRRACCRYKPSEYEDCLSLVLQRNGLEDTFIRLVQKFWQRLNRPFHFTYSSAYV
jgi:hypothetical protein